MAMIPYGHHYIDAVDREEVMRVLASGTITQGRTIGYFERALCAYTGAKYAVCVSSGTAALHIACLATGMRRGDEAITSPITFVASANAIVYSNAKPVFADIHPDTITIDSCEIRNHIGPRTKVIIPVHFAGLPCDMHTIRAIATKNNLMIIEDAAHALGAVYNGKKIGACSHADMTIFSFHPIKSITTGEGGAILTNDHVLYKRLLLLRNHGITKQRDELSMYPGPWYYEMQCLGFNYRMTDFQAALGVSQLRKLGAFLKERRSITSLYNRVFGKDNSYFDIPAHDPATAACHLYPIRLKGSLVRYRKDIVETLHKKGIGVQVHYIPVYLQPYYKRLGFKKGLCPVAETYYARTISLPLYVGLTVQQIKKIIASVFTVMKSFSNQ